MTTETKILPKKAKNAVFYIKDVRLLSRIHHFCQSIDLHYDIAPNIIDATRSGEAKNWSIMIELESTDKIDFLFETCLNYPWKNIILLSKLSRRDNLALFERYPQIDHLIPVDHVGFDKQVINVLREIHPQNHVPEKLISTDKHNPKQDFASVIRSLSNSQQINECLKSIDNYSKKLDCFKSFSSIVRMVASELLTNAFFNAPVEDTDQKTSRVQKVNLLNQKSIELEYGHNGSEFWIRVRDPFGSLKKNSLIEHLGEVNSLEKIKVNEDTSGGAGIGLFLVYSHTSEISFKIKNGSETEILCKIPMTKRNKTFDAIKPSVHFHEENIS